MAFGKGPDKVMKLLPAWWVGFAMAPAVVLATPTMGLAPTAAEGLGTGPPDDPPTYSKDVAPILQGVCLRCHVEGGLGPMPLTTYEEVLPYVRRIREYVIRRVMPPWHLDPTIGIQAYRNDISLSAEEIETIVEWADGGARG